MNGALRQSAFLMLVWLAGCATPPEPAVEAPAGEQREPDVVEVVEVDPTIVCAYESRTGTHLRERRCYTREQLEEVEDKSKEALRTRGTRGRFYVPIHPEDPRNRKKQGN